MSLDHHGSYVHEFETARRREQVTDRLTALDSSNLTNSDLSQARGLGRAFKTSETA